MKVYVVMTSFIYQMCETFYDFDSVYKNKEDAENRVNYVKSNGDDDAHILETELK